jgi:tetratricopeptide (TPR) repeat protein
MELDMDFGSENGAVSQLQAARLERGWTQARVISALATQSRLTGVAIAEPRSLKTMLSRWENGAGQPDRVYQRLFCLIYERYPEELGFVATSSTLSRTPHIAPVLDPETVSYFRDVFWQHVRADNLMGPHHLVEVVRAQAHLLDRVLPDAKSDVRSDLSKLACRYNEFTGWLYQDAGDPKNAMYYTDRALDYALAGDNSTDVAYLLMRKTNITNDLESPVRALGLSDAGMRDGSVAPRVRALILVQRARAFAMSSDIAGCVRAVDAAYTEVTHSDAGDDDNAGYCSLAYIEMEAAACWSELGLAERALPTFAHALDNWPAQMRRDLGLCQTRLAIAHARAGNPDEACRVGVQAVNTARNATSARTLRDLSRLRESLAPWRRDAQVSELAARIRSLIRTG